MKSVVVSGVFDDMRARHFRFLEEASKLGPLNVLLWPDNTVKTLENRLPKFPQEERQYFLESIRYVSKVTLVDSVPERHALPVVEGLRPDVWAVPEDEAHTGKTDFCRKGKIQCAVISNALTSQFPESPSSIDLSPSGRKRVIVTGCYDWFHSGHVRFFEEVSALGDLYVCLGHDANIRFLKGEGHPMFPATERRYIAGSIKFVRQALVSSGDGWLDAEPEIRKIKPQIYAVNEDGDKPEKAEYCRKTGIEYVVLKRLPRPGLPRRQSTDLRGF